MPTRRLLCLAGLIPCAWFASAPAPDATWTGSSAPAPIRALASAPAFDTARALLAEGKLDEARASAETELSGRPYDADGYALLLEIAERADDDAARLHWGKWLYWSHKYAGRTKPASELAARLSSVYPDWNKDEAVIDKWRDATLKAARAAAGKKQFRLAGHLLSKVLDLNPADRQLQSEWDKLVDKAGQEATGGGFQAAEVRRKSASWIAKQNAKHEDWENRWQDDSKHYSIETNMDYEFFVTLRSAMDEIHDFYREVHGYKKPVKKARMIIARKRSEFDRITQELTGNAMPSDGVGGFWMLGGANTVVAFDRSYGDPNVDRADLWHTLFHETSHQFLEQLMMKSERSGKITPAWLFEGVGSYFEGCQLKADGTVLKNNVAEHRLEAWWFTERSQERKDLAQTIGHIRNTGADATGLRSYEGVYYAYGWALTYFLLNYEENDRRVYGTPITPGEAEIPSDYKAVRKAGRLVYRDVFQEYLDFYAEEGNKKNEQMQPLRKAEELFVAKVADPDVPNWEAFENRWRKFTTSLYGEMQSGHEFADVLQARSRGYLLAEDWERARITAEQADAKRTDDPETFRLLAESNWGEKREGEAAYWMFRHWEQIWPTGQAEDLAAAETWLNGHDGRDVVNLYCKAAVEAVGATEGLMEEFIAAGHPVLAALAASHLQRALGVSFENLNAQAAECAELSGENLRMWQAAFAKGPEGNRKLQLSEGSRDVITAIEYRPDGLMIYNPAGRDTPGYERCDEGALAWLTPPYEIRGRVRVEGPQAALFLGLDRNGRPRARLTFEQTDDDDSAVGVWTLDQRTDAQIGLVVPMPTQAGGGLLSQKVPTSEPFDFEFVVDALGNCRLTVEGESIDIDAKKFTARRLLGGIALGVADDTAAVFSSIEVRPNQPFWPVAPPTE